MSPALEIQLSDGGGPYRAGAWVRGQVRIVEGGRSRALHVELRFRERSVDYSATPVTVDGPALHEGELSGGTSFDFARQLPADALPNYASPHGALFWQVAAWSDELGIDTKADTAIDVVAPP